jgi:uncharacterized membrane protein
MWLHGTCHGRQRFSAKDEPMTDAPDQSRAYVSAAVLGVVAGMRTQLPMALLAFAAREGAFASHAGPPLSLLRAPAALPVLATSALGELVVDKLPFTPSRLAPGPLLGRLACGGLAGAAVTHESKAPLFTGALLGAAGAGLGAFAGYHLRAALGRSTGISDPVWGAVEDVSALVFGAWAVSARDELRNV